MPDINDPTDPKLDRWLGKQPPRVELALRNAVRGRYRNIAARRAFDARVDELFAIIAPNNDEYAAIIRHAREIGRSMREQLDG